MVEDHAWRSPNELRPETAQTMVKPPLLRLPTFKTETLSEDLLSLNWIRKVLKTLHQIENWIFFPISHLRRKLEPNQQELNPPSRTENRHIHRKLKKWIIWRNTEQLQEEDWNHRMETLQDWNPAGLIPCRTETLHYWNSTGLKTYRTKNLQDWKPAGLKPCMTETLHDWKPAGHGWVAGLLLYNMKIWRGSKSSKRRRHFM